MSPHGDLLTAAISAAAESLPASQTAAMADAFSKFDEPTRTACKAAYKAIPTAPFRHHVDEIYEQWKQLESPVSGGAVALALRAASETAGRMRAEQRVSVVWTGPDTGAVPIRLTREVLIQVIQSATESLYIVSFAAYKVEDIVTEIAGACRKGVRVRLILETSADDGGKVGFDPALAFADVADMVEIFRWNPSARPKGASMHVKAAVADSHTAFVTSANFTGTAVADNMELGLLVIGGETPRRLTKHFDTLIDVGVLAPADRRPDPT